jgi:hypothetical protein
LADTQENIAQTGKKKPFHGPATPRIPDREILLAHRPVLIDSFEAENQSQP